MKKITLISFCLAAFAFASCAGGGCPATGIIPAPQQVTWGEGAFRMPAKLLYTTDLDGQDKADLAAWMQRAADGFFPASFAEASDGDMPALELLRTGDGAPESYRLDVSRTKITLTAPDAAGLFYGLQSLAQLAGHHGRRIPAVTIVDAPRFGYRGFMLDVSRHFRDKVPIPTGRDGTSAANATATATTRRPPGAITRRTTSAKWSNTPVPCISR